MKKKLIRITTVPQSLGGLLRGQLSYMSQYYDVLAVSSKDNNGYLAKYGHREKVRIYRVTMTRQITPFKDLKAVWQLYLLFKKEKPFIVHTHTPKAGTLGMTAAYLANVPHRLHTIAGMPLLERTGYTRKLLDLVEKITFGFATKVYPNSFEMEKIVLKNKYSDKKKLRVLGNGSSNGVDQTFFDPERYNEYRTLRFRNFLGILKTDFVFLYVGRMVKDKGIEELINAFDTISAQHEDLKLLLVGKFERELDPVSIQTEATIESNPNIIYVGSRRDVRSFYSVADVLTFPSYREGFPNVVMEAGAMGLPAIVSDINGCNEIIIDNENGIIIPPKDSETLGIEMLTLYKDRDKLQKMASKSRQMITSRYDRQFFWSELLKEYASLEECKNRPKKK